MRTKGKFEKRLIFLLMLALLATGSGIRLYLDRVPAQLESSYGQRHLFFTLPAFADFDGDNLPDLAELVSNGFQKHIHLLFGSQSGANLHFSTETSHSGRLHTGDIDSDNDDDLIWISNQAPLQTALWLNNGEGEFTRVPDPTVYSAKVERLVFNKSSNSQFTPAEDEWVLATAPNAGSCLKRTEHHPFELLETTPLPLSARTCHAELASHLACHPKRGPPANLG
jgi:hypothetical protein